MIKFLAEARKSLVALVGLIAQIIALGVLEDDALHWAQVAVAVLTTVAVYLVPNARPSVDPPPG